MEQDSSSLYCIARALMQLQQLHGTIPHVKGKGEAAAAVQRIAARMRQEMGRDAPAAAGGRGGASVRGAGCRQDLCSVRCLV